MDIMKKNTKISLKQAQKTIFFAYQQGKVFRKFKENRKFNTLVEQFKITKATIIFKINILKLIDKYPKMMNLSITLKLFKKLLQTY